MAGSQVQDCKGIREEPLTGGKEAREESGLTAALLGVSLLGARKPWGPGGGGRKGREKRGEAWKRRTVEAEGEKGDYDGYEDERRENERREDEVKRREREREGRERNGKSCLKLSR